MFLAEMYRILPGLTGWHYLLSIIYYLLSIIYYLCLMAPDCEAAAFTFVFVILAYFYAE